MSEMSANPRPTVIQTSSDYPEAPTTSHESECLRVRVPQCAGTCGTDLDSEAHVPSALRDTQATCELPGEMLLEVIFFRFAIYQDPTGGILRSSVGLPQSR